MIGITHLAAGACAGVLFASSPIGLAGVILGSRIPDQIDFFVAGRNRKLFEKIHRKTSHNLFWWTLCFMITLFIGHALFPVSLFNFSVWFLFGVIIHLVLDSLTKSGIPILPFKNEKMGFRFCYTKGFFDYGLCLFFFFVSIYFLFNEGRLIYFKDQIF